MSCSHEHYEDFFETAKVGKPVRDFTLETFGPAEDGFGQISLEEIKKRGTWTILGVYSTGGTFV